MKISEKGLNLIIEFEGLRLEPYLCDAGRPTIGYGTTIYPNGVKVTLEDSKITKTQAREYLNDILSELCRKLPISDKIVTTQNQYDALVSLAYNIGLQAFKDSTLLKFLKLGNYKKAGLEILKWDKVKGRANKGLSRRRAAEYELFNKPVV